MLWKCCTQYASKPGKLSSGHRTGKGQFSFQSQRKAMPENAQTTALYSLGSINSVVTKACRRILVEGNAKECSNYRTSAFTSHTSTVMLKILQTRLPQYTWTVNFQMFKLAEKPEIKLSTSAGSQKKQERFQKHIYFCFIDYTKAFDCVDQNKLLKILKKDGNT